MRRSKPVYQNHTTPHQTVKRFPNRVALVTGGGRGIGYGIARKLAREGAHVQLIDRDAGTLSHASESLKKEGFTNHATWKCDVTKIENVRSTVRDIYSKHGQIDILVQSAGITGKTNIKVHEVDPDDFRTVLEVNLIGTFNFCREVLPFMLEKNYGRIVNIASVAGKEGNAGMSSYSASKAGVIGLTKSIGKEYAETGITCNAIAPAVIRTAMVDALPPEQIKYMTDKIPMKRTGDIEELAELVAFIVSKECSFTTGFTFDATGGRATY